MISIYIFYVSGINTYADTRRPRKFLPWQCDVRMNERRTEIWKRQSR